MKPRLVLWFLLAVAAPTTAVAGETGVRVTLPILASNPGLDPTVRQGFDETQLQSGLPATCSFSSAPYCFPAYTQWAKPIFLFPVNNFDYGGGNIIYGGVYLYAANPALLGLFGGTQLGYAHVRAIGDSAKGSAILQVSGYVTNVTLAHVEAQVTFRFHAASDHHAVRPLTLTLQQYDGTTWRTIRSGTITPCDVDVTPSCGNQTLAIDGWANPNSDVRAQLINTADGNVSIDIYEATLFGAECFPDTSSPDLACISQ